MNKGNAINIITDAVKKYEKYFMNKNLLIVCGKQSEDKLSYPYLTFYVINSSKANFLHLTGVKLSGIDENTGERLNGIDAELFYEKAKNKHLQNLDFSFKSDNTTVMKLEVVQAALNLPNNFKTCGEYNYNSSHDRLDTDLLIGNTNSCLGFRQTVNGYVPNTLLKSNVNNEIERSPYQRVSAVFDKKNNENVYSNVSYLAKDGFVSKLIQILQHQNPEIKFNENKCLESLKPNQIKNQEVFLHHSEIKLLAEELRQARSDYLKDSENMDLLERYDTMQNNFVLKAKEYDIYDYAESLLNQQKTVSKSSEVVKYIDSDIQVLKRAFGFTMRSADIVRNVYADFPEANPAAAHKALFALPMPPEHPFRALWVKAREIVRNIAGSLHRTEKTPDKTVQAEKIEPTGNTEKDDLIVLDIYNMSVKKQNDYMEFVNTSKSMGEIELQTGLLFEQTAAQEHFIQPEQVQVEVKRKSENFEYGD